MKIRLSHIATLFMIAFQEKNKAVGTTLIFYNCPKEITTYFYCCYDFAI